MKRIDGKTRNHIIIGLIFVGLILILLGEHNLTEFDSATSVMVLIKGTVDYLKP